HLDVADDEVGVELDGELDGLLAVGRFPDDVESFLLQHLPQVQADQCLVLSDQLPLDRSVSHFEAVRVSHTASSGMVGLRGRQPIAGSMTFAHDAPVTELAYVMVSNTIAERRVGSNPTRGTDPADPNLSSRARSPRGRRAQRRGTSSGPRAARRQRR